MNILFSNRSSLFAIRIIALAYVLFTAFRGMLRNGFHSDLFLLVLMLGAWFLIAALIAGFQRRFNWHERTTSLLTSAMDAYFLMTAIDLAAAPPYIALMALATFCFAVAFATGPLFAMSSFLTGLIGFVSAYFVTAHSWRPSYLYLVGVPLLGVLCGLAWRIVVPMLWKAIQIIISDPEAVNRGVAPGAPGGASNPDATAALAALEEEKARLMADMENVRAEVDMLKILSARRQKSFEDAEKEKEALKRELEAAQKEIEKMFGMDSPAQPQAVAPADGVAVAPDAALQARIAELEKELATALNEIEKMFGMDSPPQPQAAAPADGSAVAPDAGLQARTAELEKELAAAQLRLEQVESEKQALAAELEKTSAELMKAYGA